MSQYAYLTALVVSLASLTAIDHRFRIAMFDQPRRAALTLVVAVAAFLAWDAAGVGLGIFFVGESPYQSGILLAPEIPLEEPFFLMLLAYQTLLLWRWLDRRARRRARGPAAPEEAAP